MNKYIVKTTDNVVKEVIKKMDGRSSTGIKKYGTTLDRNDLSTIDWIDHAIEEGMDQILYLTKLKQELMRNELRTET